MTGQQLRVGSLFSGTGGLDLAVEHAFGARTVWHAEWEDAPSMVLARHWPGVPNYRDVTAVDWAAVEPVDIIAGGFPCQDVSLAGRRAGMTEGTRSNLWGAMRSAVEIIRPTYVVAENVRGLLSAHAESDSDMEPGPGLLGDRSGGHLRALGRVLGDLADLGYDAQWCGLRASDVGAPHHRFRVFILATRAADRDGIRGDRPRAPRLEEGRGEPADSCVGTPDARSGGRDRWEGVSGDGRDESLGGETVHHPLDGGAPPDHHTDWGQYGPAIRRWEAVLGREAPAPTEVTARGKHRLSPRFTEFMMGLPAGWVTDTPGITRNPALKMCGNGVVPQQAVAALHHMLTSAKGTP